MPSAPCADTAPGLDTVRCRVDLLAHDVGTADATDLGGTKAAHRFAIRVAKTHKLLGDPTSTRHFKAAAKQLKRFMVQLDAAAAKGKIAPDLAATLRSIATDARADLAGMIA